MMKATRPKIGDETWEVEWMSFAAHDECGDFDPDKSTYSFRLFKTKAGAVKFATKVLPQSKMGTVRVTPMRFEPYDDADSLRYPHVGYWEATGETEYYEGEE